jgi:hypothetical protein
MVLNEMGLLSPRRSRLAAVAGIRTFWEELDEERRNAVEKAELYADRQISFDELATVALDVGELLDGSRLSAVSYVTHRLARMALSTVATGYLARHDAAEPRAMMAVFRDIFGNPFRPVVFPQTWRTTAVLGLARGIYDEKAFDRLPILADALEEAGCDNADVLAHCRGPGPHVRGCWVIDGVLGLK